MTTRIVSMAITRQLLEHAGAAHGHRARRPRRRPSARAPNSAREVRTIGTRAPSTMPAPSALAKKARFLASMLPASRSGTTRICARPATSDLMPLIRAASTIDGVVEGQRPVEHAAGDLPAIGHLAERRRLDRRGDFRGHGFDRRQDRDARRLPKPDLRVEIDRVLDDVALGVEIGKDLIAASVMNSVSA